MTINMTLVIELNRHLGDEQLESYSIGNLAEQDIVRLEEHVLICEACQDKLALSDSWVRSVRRPALKPAAAQGPGQRTRVPALRPLMLGPGLEGLRPLDRYHLEMVDRLGKKI